MEGRAVGKSGNRFKGPSDEEREAIQQREQAELQKNIQLTADQERRMKAMQTGGRRALLFNSVLGTKDPAAQPAANMGTRG
jgi:hypothetical protein